MVIAPPTSCLSNLVSSWFTRPEARIPVRGALGVGAGPTEDVFVMP